MSERKAKRKELHLENRIKELPSEAMGCVLEFCMDQYRDIVRVTNGWKFACSEAMDTLCRELETGFINTYAEVLLFKESWVAQSTMSFSGEKGLRVDRVIQSEPLPSAVNKSIKVAFTYKFYGEHDYYRAEYRFDVMRRGPRVVWLHKDNNQVCFTLIYSSTMETR